MIKNYIQGSFKELHNVTWPTQKQAIRITTIVLVFLVISAAVLGVVDQLLSYGYQQLLQISTSIESVAV